MGTVAEILNWRYATKKFDKTRKISADDFQELEDALRLSPSSFGLQPWGFVVVENPSVRNKLLARAFNQPQIVNASHLIVLCARTDVNESFIRRFVEQTANARGATYESLAMFEQTLIGFRKSLSDEQMLEWSKQQVHLAAGILLFAAAQKKIDACPMGGFDPAGFDEALGLRKKNLASTVLVALGYRSLDDKYSLAKKVRFSKDEVFVDI